MPAIGLLKEQRNERRKVVQPIGTRLAMPCNHYLLQAGLGAVGKGRYVVTVGLQADITHIVKDTIVRELAILERIVDHCAGRQHKTAEQLGVAVFVKNHIALMVFDHQHTHH